MRCLGGIALLAAASWSPAVIAQDTGDQAAGHEFARSVCAECHAVEAGESVSPNPLAPSFTRIADTPGMTKTALIVVLSNPHREMPDLILDRGDLNDVAAYILTLKTTD